MFQKVVLPKTSVRNTEAAIWWLALTFGMKTGNVQSAVKEIDVTTTL